MTQLILNAHFPSSASSWRCCPSSSLLSQPRESTSASQTDHIGVPLKHKPTQDVHTNSHVHLPKDTHTQRTSSTGSGTNLSNRCLQTASAESPLDTVRWSVARTANYLSASSNTHPWAYSFYSLKFRSKIYKRGLDSMTGGVDICLRTLFKIESATDSQFSTICIFRAVSKGA